MIVVMQKWCLLSGVNGVRSKLQCLIFQLFTQPYSYQTQDSTTFTNNILPNHSSTTSTTTTATILPNNPNSTHPTAPTHHTNPFADNDFLKVGVACVIKAPPPSPFMTFDPQKDDVTVDLVNVLNFRLEADEYERLLSNVVWVRPGEKWRKVGKGDLEFQVSLRCWCFPTIHSSI